MFKGTILIIYVCENANFPLSRFLSDEDDDVSEGVFEFCHSYIGLLKQLNGCNPIPNQNLHITNILSVILNKMKYDEDFNFDHKVSKS